MPPPPGGYGAPPAYGAPGGGFVQPPPGSAGGSNNLALAALIVGVISIFICQPAGLVAIGLGIAGLSKSKVLGVGRGQAIGGIVTGIIAIAVGVVAVLALGWFGETVSSNLDEGINTDPSDGECNFDRFMQDPDC